jgi:hypothetical protein
VDLVERGASELAQRMYPLGIERCPVGDVPIASVFGVNNRINGT